MAANFCSNCGNSVMVNDQFCRHCGDPLSETAKQFPHSQPFQQPKRQGASPLLIIGLIAGAVLIFAAFWLSQPNSAEAPSRLESNPVSQENAGLPYPEVARIDLDEAKRRFDAGTAVFVDTRDLDEYEAAHIPGAVHMTLADIETRHRELVDSPEIITYCT
ncbi:MAG: zinc-ribbon domain-containing protein [Chloroflexi bacterium]|nr:MAG: zinc-ribbon domain-containing protein [Chloroflexota bacterium]